MFEVYVPPPPPRSRGRPKSLGKPLVIIGEGPARKAKCVQKRGKLVYLTTCIMSCTFYMGKVKNKMICSYGKASGE